METVYRTMRASTLGFALAVALVPAVPTAGGEGGFEPQDVLRIKRLAPRGAEAEQEKHDRELDRVIASVRSTFRERDPSRLAPCLGSRKVYVSIGPVGPGWYTKSQVLFLLEKFFRDLKTESFEHSRDDVTVSDDGRAYFISEWTYMLLDSDKVITERLHVSFQKEDDAWRISEMKAASR